MVHQRKSSTVRSDSGSHPCSPLLGEVFHQQRRHSLREPLRIGGRAYSIAFYLRCGAPLTILAIYLCLFWSYGPALADVPVPSALSEDACDPFVKPGRLHLNASDYLDSSWLPLDESCQPLNYMRQLATKDVHFPWLQDRTVALIGDSIDRYHIDHFCELVQGNLTVVKPDNPLSPPPVTLIRPGEQLGLQTEDDVNMYLTRPHICHLAEHNFTIVSIFHYGLSTTHEFQAEIDGSGAETLYTMGHYFPPATVQERIEAFLVVLLRNLGRQPDIIEFGSTFWDVMHWFRVDRVENGGDERASTWQELKQDRLTEWARRLHNTLLAITTTFPTTPRILWRVPNTPEKNWVVPPSRVAAVSVIGDDTINKIISRKQTLWQSVASRLKVKGERSLSALSPAQRLSLVLKRDNWGELIRGQSQWMADDIHPTILLGGPLWGEIMLQELRTLHKL